MGYTSALQKLAESLITTYKNTIFSHPGDVGDSREKELIKYLRKVMPNKFGFDSGEAFDKNDDSSGQVDVIIYDNLFSTVFNDGSGKILAPVESTYGIISIKSLMNTGKLDDVIEGIKKYDQLTRTQPKEGALYLTPDTPLEAGAGINFSQPKQQNINCIFAFDTDIATKTILNKVRDAGCVDLLVIPEKICVIGRSRRELPLLKEDGSKLFNSAIVHPYAVSLFVLLLQLYLSKNLLVARNLEDLVLWIARESSIQSS